MPIEAGEAVAEGEVSLTRDEGSLSAGDVAMISGDGSLAAADTEAGDLAGVVTEGGGLGVTGIYVAAAADAVADGNAVTAGNATGTSTGQFIADSSGNALALSDEGGTWQGMSVPAGYAVVKL